MYHGRGLVKSEAEKRGRMSFDEVFDEFEARELARRIMWQYIRGLSSSVDSEACMWMHIDRIGRSATDADIAATLARIDVREAESLYGRRVGVAAARGRRQGNHSALRCFVREVRRARRDMITVAAQLADG